MTDRFARTDGSTTSACNTTAGLYCGGTWRGTMEHLDYIQGMGFDAVMISPIVENIEGRVDYGEAYHGYWPLNLESLNSHFGTKQDLLDLSDALHSRGMYLMMDTVINNMAYMTHGQDPAKAIDYSVFTPFNSSDYFHPYCKITDWNDFSDAQLCQTGDLEVALPDLFTEHGDVQDRLVSWAQEMIKTYSIDGLRIDAAKHVNGDFLAKFGDAVDLFITGEVLQGQVDIICEYQSQYITSMPNYPIYYSMLDAFTKGNTSSLVNQVEAMKNACNDVTALVSFSENHDMARVPSMNKDIALAKNALTFTILFDGIPMIYQGQEQHLNGAGTPHNREALWLSKYDTQAELYQLISKLNAIRKHAYQLGSDYLDTQTAPLYRGGSELVFRKGVDGRHVVMVLSTQGAQGHPYPLKLWVSYNPGTAVMDVLNCVNYTVDGYGELIVPMDKGEPRVLFPTELMGGSGLCGYPLDNVTFAELKTGQDSSVQTSLGAKMTGNVALLAMLSLGASLGFEWHAPADRMHWARLQRALPGLKAIGVDYIWLPPGCKGMDPSGNGYDVYDLYDLGEFDQKGSSSTKWGSREELNELVHEAHALGLGIYWDAVLNHKAGADHTERFQAVRVDPKRRNVVTSTPLEIEGWVGFHFEGRGSLYSPTKYHSQHFSGVDWDQRSKENAIFRVLGPNKGWAQDVSTENGNYDYLMFADLDLSHPEVREDLLNWGTWITNELALDGMRLDAAKHMSTGFQKTFVEHLRTTANPNCFIMGEYWTGDVREVMQYLEEMQYTVCAYDVPLLNRFSSLSRTKGADLRGVFTDTLVQRRPGHAVTIVANHDTQPGQMMDTPVMPWFKPLAYALILLRKEGYPCVFYGDVYGIRANVKHPMTPACNGKLPILTQARKSFAYGEQQDYFDTPNCIGFVRYGNARHRGLACVMSNAGPATKRMYVGPGHINEEWTDILHAGRPSVFIDKRGYGDFPVDSMSVSVWVDSAAADAAILREDLYVLPFVSLDFVSLESPSYVTD
nr:glycoside hydrolase [Aspergillus sp.]